MHLNKKIPFFQALLWIFLSIIMVTGTTMMVSYYVRYKQILKKENPFYNIKAIVQTGPVKEALKTVYLAEILELSVDQPVNLYSFDLKKAEDTLLQCPIIEKASVQRWPPDALYVDYTLFSPIAFLAEYTNTALDSHGYAFPIHPFYTPKRLPEIYWGSNNNLNTSEIWGHYFVDERMELTLEILAILSQPQYRDIFVIQRIDVSKSFEESPGRKEIVLIVEDSLEIDNKIITLPCTLRLSPKNYLQELGNYLALRKDFKNRKNILKIDENLNASNLTIDLRIPQVAYMSY